MHCFSTFRKSRAAFDPSSASQYGHIYSFGHVAPKGGREDLLPLNKHVRYKKHVRWSPRIVHGPMPTDAPILKPLHMLSAPFVPTNLGHLAWEEAFPVQLPFDAWRLWSLLRLCPLCDRLYAAAV